MVIAIGKLDSERCIKSPSTDRTKCTSAYTRMGSFPCEVMTGIYAQVMETNKTKVCKCAGTRRDHLYTRIKRKISGMNAAYKVSSVKLAYCKLTNSLLFERYRSPSEPTLLSFRPSGHPRGENPGPAQRQCFPLQ